MLKTGLRNLIHLIATAVLLVGLGTSTTALAAAAPGHQPDLYLMTTNDLTAAAPTPTPDNLLGQRLRDTSTELISADGLMLMDGTLRGATGGLADDDPSSPAAPLGLSFG